MTLALQESKTDHHGQNLPADIRARIRKDTGALVSFRVRWRQVDDRGLDYGPADHSRFASSALPIALWRRRPSSWPELSRPRVSTEGKGDDPQP